MHDGSRRGDETAVNVNRSHVFEESFRELHRKSPDEWKNKFYVVFESKLIFNVRTLEPTSLNEQNQFHVRLQVKRVRMEADFSESGT